jgi:hypothetical protein
LNLLVAQAIRTLTPGRDTLVHVPPFWSSKQQFYHDRFDWDQKIFSDVHRSSLPDLADQALRTTSILSSLNGSHFDQLVFANIGSIVFSSLAKRYSDASVITFDDGTLHADVERLKRWLRDQPLTHRIYRRLTGACSNEDILARVERHYTIFPVELCALDVPRVVEIPLFARLPAPLPTSEQVIVLLGTPAPHISLGIDEYEYERLLNLLKPDIYLPHPMEKRSAAIRISMQHQQLLTKAADTLIAEDFVSELVRLGYNPAIHGFGSTALLNLSRQLTTKTYCSSGRPPERIFAKLGVTIEPVERLLS